MGNLNPELVQYISYSLAEGMETSFTQTSLKAETEETAKLLGPEADPPTPQYTIDTALQKMGLGLFQLNAFNFGGLFWLSHAVIALHSALLSASWQCEFQISNAQLATITVMYPLGNGIGSVVYGVLSDRYGRKKVLNLANLLLLYFGLLSSFVPNYPWLLMLRLIIGFLAIANSQVTTYSVEFMPIRFRSPAVMLLNIYWTFGILLLVLLCYLIIPILGWRYLVFISCLPMGILPIYYWFAPTSPRFLMRKGRLREAGEVLNLGAKMNCSRLPEGELVQDEPPTHSSQKLGDTDTSLPKEKLHKHMKIIKNSTRDLLEIFSKKHRFTTLLLVCIWFTSAFIYYGAVLMTQDVFLYDTHCPGDLANRSHAEVRRFCHPLSPEDYRDYLITTTAEVPGIVLSVFILEIIGRKLTFALEFFIAGGSFFILLICTAYDRVIKTGVLFLIRGNVAAVFLVTYLYTTEVYPTEIRATSLSIFSSCARVAVIIASFTAQVLLRESFVAAISLFGVLGVFTAFLSLLLPRETKGKKIK